MIIHESVFMYRKFCKIELRLIWNIKMIRCGSRRINKLILELIEISINDRPKVIILYFSVFFFFVNFSFEEHSTH